MVVLLLSLVVVAVVSLLLLLAPTGLISGLSHVTAFHTWNISLRKQHFLFVTFPYYNVYLKLFTSKLFWPYSQYAGNGLKWVKTLNVIHVRNTRFLENY